MPSTGSNIGEDAPLVDKGQESESEGEVETVNAVRDPRLFRDENNRRVGFFFHKSIKKEDQRQKLKDDIRKHGGLVVKYDYEADTVLIDILRCDKQTLQISYNAASDLRLHKVYVESMSFVTRCIQQGYFAHRPPIFKGMGGTDWRKREQFTADDDERLCEYLARLMPDKAAGGRQGLKVYTYLVNAAKLSPHRYAWAARHTPESWKERYKKNAPRFDRIIEDIAKIEPPSKKQLWSEDRRASQARMKRRDFMELDSNGEEMENEESEEEEEEEHGHDVHNDANYAQPSRKRRRSDRVSQPAEPATKRPRVLEPRQRQKSPSRQISSSKGKEKAIDREEEEEDDEEYHETSLFSVNRDATNLNILPDEFEPGPSGHARSLERTLVASAPTHRTQPTSASFFSQQPMLNPAPLGKPSNATPNPADRTGNSGHLSQRGSQRAVQSSPPAPLSSSPLRQSQYTRTFQDVDYPSGPVQSTPSQTSSAKNRSERPVNPSQLISPTPLPPLPARPSNPSYQPPRKAARRPAAVAQPPVEDAAPYRNTRSRSRSVEPSVLPPATRPRQKRKQKETIPEEEPEVIDISDGEQNVLQEPLPPDGETLVEEMVVANLLTAQSLLHNSVNVRREASMETDDAQIARNLRVPPTASQIRPTKGFSSLRVRPTDILKQFESDSTSRNPYSVPLNSLQLNRSSSVIRSKVSGQPPPLQNDPSKARRESALFNFKIPEPEPHTPAQRTRKSSVSSSESFPVSGTRASALKKSLQQREKHTPYRPPEGTRAAQIAMSR